MSTQWATSLRRPAPFGNLVDVAVGLCVGLAAGVVAQFLAFPGYLVVALACLALTVAGLWRPMVRTRGAMLFRPAPVSLLVCLAAVSIVPLTWALGWATPWQEVVGREATSVLWGSLFLCSYGMGIHFGLGREGPALDEGFSTRPGGERMHEASKPGMSVESRLPRHRDLDLTASLITAAVIGLAGVFLIVASGGGVNEVIAGLVHRRETLAGIGPTMVLVFVPAVALAYRFAVIGVAWTWSHRVAGLLAAFVFLWGVYLTGQKAHAIWLGLLALGSVAHRGRVNPILPAILCLAIVPVSTLYHFKVRQEASIGHSEGTVITGSLSEFISTTWNPFASSGLDQLRTLSVLTSEAPAVAARPEPVVRGLSNMIPRTVWASKPQPAPLEFTEIYFPQHYWSGTGIPPSLFAESVWLFGIGGGLIVTLLAGVCVGRIDAYLRERSGPGFAVLSGVLTVAAVMLVRAGSESALRASTLLLGASAVLFGLNRALIRVTSRHAPVTSTTTS